MGDESRLRAVVELAQGMAAAQGLAELARAAVDGAGAALGGSAAVLSVWERERGRSRVLAETGEPSAGEERPGPWASGDEPCVRTDAGGRRMVVPVVLDGRVWGELSVTRDAGAEAFGPGERDFASVLAAVIAAGIVQYERLAEARRLAFTDPLTGLANRRAVDIRLDEALEEHRATGAVISLVVCDVNGLKKVNDTYGHATGDRLLERFGAVLSRCGAAVPGALAARLGGDEFCLLAVGTRAAEVERAAEEVCRRAQELDLGEGVACGVASTGEAIGRPLSARRLFRLADAAQYRAKAARSPVPVVAGRGGRYDVVVALADAPARRGGERRRFRGRRPGA
ncbi:diguanylate cyclase domain-containing protein [Streptomyces sp. NBC_01803]|uniref:diguanylate cyclase domain-containing protein n=1 Tax=Streptomyces sp. NBC_01803 TaxID=2975946 RepID=UPI002DDB91C9|nr:diguanylate cyclase [Streptomyces sp. NBC_01803]WSA45919.1 diguanylate cyclase [Streptomyces sp. NBC_01803]